MGTRFWGTVFLALFCPAVSNASNLSTLFGHNLTPTSYLLEEGQVTVGAYAIGYGITKRWTLATSPWMILSYNMPMVASKFLIAEGDTTRLSLETSFFKTFDYYIPLPYPHGQYDQESFFTRLVGTKRWGQYALHVCYGWQYFLREGRPFSLRLDPGSADPSTHSLSVLNEINITPYVGLFFEGGILGLNYAGPYLHLGASLFVQSSWGMVQAGLSASMRTNNNAVFWDRDLDVDVFHERHIHPEIQLQSYF
ncbi:hypothetical protein K2X33_11915 [bacterium]|nr:hypothetical protein [bacterium]